MAKSMDTFIILHSKTGKQETVTETQFEMIKNKFPGMFKKLDNPKADLSKFSTPAKDIIKEAEKKEEVKKTGVEFDN